MGSMWCRGAQPVITDEDLVRLANIHKNRPSLYYQLLRTGIGTGATGRISLGKQSNRPCS